MGSAADLTLLKSLNTSETNVPIAYSEDAIANTFSKIYESQLKYTPEFGCVLNHR